MGASLERPSGGRTPPDVKEFKLLGFKPSTEEKSPSGLSYPDFLDCKKNATLFESFQFR